MTPSDIEAMLRRVVREELERQFPKARRPRRHRCSEGCLCCFGAANYGPRRCTCNEGL